MVKEQSRSLMKEIEKVKREGEREKKEKVELRQEVEDTKLQYIELEEKRYELPEHLKQINLDLLKELEE